MAHNINEGRMFYHGEKPWHGLGVELDHPATSAEAISLARLDYQIVLQDIKTENGVIIPGKKATVRLDTNKPLGVVSDRYKIVQNVDAFSFFDVIVGEGQAIYHTAGALGEGEKLWILAKLPKDLILVREDIVEKYLLLTNTHDGKSSLKMYFTPVRVVCENTLLMSLADQADGISIRHTGNIKDKVDEARRLLGIATKFYEDFAVTSARLVEYKMKTNEVESYFDGLIFGDGVDDKDRASTRLINQKSDLIGLFEHGKGNEIPGVKHSAWAALNAVTEYVDHYKGQRSAPANRLKSIWFGGGADLKSEAYNRILDLVQVR